MLLNILYYFLLVMPAEVRSNLHDLNCRECTNGSQCDEGRELERTAAIVRDLYTARVVH